MKQQDKDIRLLADEIRFRERSYRRKTPVWGVMSFVLHIVFFAVVIFCTPVKDIITAKEEQPPQNPAEDLSADRLEEISDRLEEAKRNELADQLEDMQAVLHNMDMMKQELQKDYDFFAEENAETMKDELEKLLDEVQQAQQEALKNEKKVEEKIEELVKEEQQNLEDKERSEKLRKLSDELMLDEGVKVIDQMSKAVAALDKVNVQAEFVGLKETAKKAEKALEDQKEVAAKQEKSQRDAADTATELAKKPHQMSELERLEKWKKDQTERLEREKSNEKTAESKQEEAKEGQKKAKEDKANAEKKSEEAEKARDAAKKAEQEFRDKAKEAKSNSQERKDYEAKAREKSNEARQKEHERNHERNQARNHQRALEHQERQQKDWERREEHHIRQQEDAKRQIAEAEKRIAELKERMAQTEKVRREKANSKQLDSVKEAKKAQEELVGRIDEVRNALKSDRNQLEKLAAEHFMDQAMVRQDFSQMSMVEAYNAAKELEMRITESYKDLKATKSAIEMRMSFKSAQKITDVAKAERMEIDEAMKSALESTVRTKDALDRQKVAQTELMREAENIVEATKSLMDEAMTIVKPEFSRATSSGKMKRGGGERVEWLTEDNFKSHSSEEERAKRLAEMRQNAEYQLDLAEAAAEDESQRVKDVASVTRRGMSMDGESGDAEGQGQSAMPGSQMPTHVGGSGVQRSSEGKDSFFRGRGGPGPIQGNMPELLPGNVLRLGGADGAADPKGGLAAKWMYINSWHVIGPFPNPNRVNITRKFPPESVIDLDATYVGKGGKIIRWEFMQAASSVRSWWGSPFKARIKLHGDHQYEIWYAYTEVFSDVEADVWMAVGSDDRSDVWLNHQKVWASSNRLKAWNIAEGHRKVHLRRGRNKILMRVENGWGPLEWSLCIGLD